jgi:hypothetical protein
MHQFLHGDFQFRVCDLHRIIYRTIYTLCQPFFCKYSKQQALKAPPSIAKFAQKTHKSIANRLHAPFYAPLHDHRNWIFIINSELVNAIKTKEDVKSTFLAEYIRDLDWKRARGHVTCQKSAIHESSDISKLDEEIVLGNIEGRS